MNHTPAPWHYSRRSAKGKGFGVYDSQGRTLALVDSTPITEARREADARLMAAAPELADLADIVLGIAGRLADPNNAPCPMPPTIEQWQVIVNAAKAAKAKL